MPRRRVERKSVDPRWIRDKSDELAIEQGCWFDGDAADFAVRFIETFCRRTKGRLHDNRTDLIPWQRDLVSRLFGWKQADGLRRFRSAYVEIPKKNGKSFLMSALSLYLALADGESGAEIFVAACNSKQARIVFDEAVKMIALCPEFKKRLKINANAKLITYRTTFSKIEAVTADADSQDGWDAHGVIFDELHRQKTSKLWDVFQYATSARDQPLNIAITTAGQHKHGVCWEQHERSRKVLSGESKETTHLAMIFCAEKDDPIEEKSTWYKANPSLGFTLKEEVFRSDLEKVRESPSGLSNFLRLRLNIWTQPDTAYIAAEHWLKCNRMSPAEWKAHLASLEGQPCMGGIDLSSKKDLTAFSLIFGDLENGFTILPSFWIPETEAKEREKVDAIPYGKWKEKGLITLTPGSAINYDLVEAKIVELSQQYRIKGVVSDDWGSAEAVCQRLKKHKIKVDYCRQGFKTMSEPTKELERLAIMGKINTGGNEILTWMNQNAIVVSDATGNIKLEKENRTSPRKIDGLIATIEALYGEMLSAKKPANVYSQRKVDFVVRK